MSWPANYFEHFDVAQAKKWRLRTNPTPAESAYQAEVAIGALPANQVELDHWYQLDQLADKMPAR